MKPQPSKLVRKRASPELLKLRVLRPGDPGYEETFRYAVEEPLFDAVTTRIPFTDIDQLKRMVQGFSEEIERRYKGGS